jgi:hypothetical protein
LSGIKVAGDFSLVLIKMAPGQHLRTLLVFTSLIVQVWSRPQGDDFDVVFASNTYNNNPVSQCSGDCPEVFYSTLFYVDIKVSCNIILLYLF